MYLSDFIFIAHICAGAIIGKGLRACKFMIRGGSSDYVAMASYLSREASNWTGDCSNRSIEGLELDLEAHIPW